MIPFVCLYFCIKYIAFAFASVVSTLSLLFASVELLLWFFGWLFLFCLLCICFACLCMHSLVGWKSALALVNTFHFIVILSVPWHGMAWHIVRSSFRSYFVSHVAVCPCECVSVSVCVCVFLCVCESLWRASTSYLLNYIRCESVGFWI